MNLIVDASVVVKWFIDEEGKEAARALPATHSLIAPDLVLIETFNAVWKRARRGEATQAQVEAVAQVLPGLLQRLVPQAHLFPASAILARELRHPIYDCLYIALALDDGSPLVTADREQHDAALRARVEARMV